MGKVWVKGKSPLASFSPSSPNWTMKLQKHFHTHWHGFVSKEINGLIAVIFHMSQAVPLVPSIRKDINADLASCQVGRETHKLKVKRRLMTCHQKECAIEPVSD